MIQQNVLDKLGACISQHILIYPKLSVKAEQFESLFSYATGSDWTPYNHNPGCDMNTDLEGLKQPSLKSGKILNNILTISSHRTTKYKTLKEKIDFLNNTDYDSYICLARPDNKIHHYKLIYFPKSIIDFSILTWSENFDKKGNVIGWVGFNEDNTIKVRIVKSMSDQVWIDIDESLITIIKEFNYEITE